MTEAALRSTALHSAEPEAYLEQESIGEMVIAGAGKEIGVVGR